MHSLRRLIVLTAILIMGLAVFEVRSAISCPFCSAPSLTLSEQVSQADAVLLVKWVGGKAGDLANLGSTEFEIVDVVRQPDGGKFAKGEKVQLVRYRAAKADDLFMLFGTAVETAGIEWGSPLEVTKAAYEYMSRAPKPGLSAAERLPYFVGYLEHSDSMISTDAFGEFANAAYADVAKLAPKLPRENLKKWVTSKDVTPGRMGLYGMMLGLCGHPNDAKLLQDRIMEKSDQYPLGMDGIMGGFLLLTGDKGLDLLEKEKFLNEKAPFSETYAAMQAVRFMWQYGDGRISQDRLRQSMRMLLDRPELVDLVVADLSRMKDWTVQDKLMAMYDLETNIPSVKRAIVRYMLSSIKDTGEKKPEGSVGDVDVKNLTDQAKSVDSLPAHVVKGQQCLKELEKKDPKTVNEARRFFLLK